MSTQNGLLTRRCVLTTVSVFTGSIVTGCFSPQMGGTVAEMFIYNSTTGEVEILLKVYRVQDDKLIINDTFALASESSREYAEPFDKDGRKRLEIVINGDRRASYEWEANAEQNSVGVDINIYDDRIDIDEEGR